MDTLDLPFLALACPWDGLWQVFVLSPHEGLVGSADVPTYADVEVRARDIVSRHLGGPAHHVALQVLRRGGADEDPPRSRGMPLPAVTVGRWTRRSRRRVR